MEDMISDYVGIKGSGNKMKLNRASSTRLVAVLTCLQFGFAVYATFLLYFMSPAVDLRHDKPNFPWPPRMASQWKHELSQYQHSASSLVLAEPGSSAALLQQPVTPSQVCEQEKINFVQKKSNDTVMIKLKRELYDEVLEFQKKSFGPETLAELMAMKSKWAATGPTQPKITVVLNHFKRKTLCAQLDSLLHQTLAFHHVWVLSFGSPNEVSLRRIVESYNDSRISFVSSSYDFKYYGRQVYYYMIKHYRDGSV